MLAPGYEHHVLPGLGQPPAEVPANSSCAKNRNSHRTLQVNGMLNFFVGYWNFSKVIKATRKKQIKKGSRARKFPLEPSVGYPGETSSHNNHQRLSGFIVGFTWLRRVGPSCLAISITCTLPS